MCSISMMLFNQVCIDMVQVSTCKTTILCCIDSQTSGQQKIRAISKMPEAIQTLSTPDSIIESTR